jgi:uncharacterized protein (TIGR03083 family)
MPTDRDLVTKCYPIELEAFEDLLRSLSPEQWTAPTRCEGWRVCDVAAHVAGTLDNIVNGRFDGLGSPEVTAAEVSDREGRSPHEVAEEIRACADAAAGLLAVFDDDAWSGPSPAGAVPTRGDGGESLWYDTWLHGEDIREAAGLPRVTTGESVGAAVRHVAVVLDSQGWGPAVLALDGQDAVVVGDGSGPHITGDAYRFVLAATGRIPAADIGEDDTVNIYR